MSPGAGDAEEFDIRANRLFEAGDFDGAVRILRDATSRFPDSAELFVSLGYAELAREEIAWARRAFEAALGLLPELEDALVGLGEAMLRLGERARALRLFDHALEVGFAAEEDLLLAMARALAREGLDERAERMLRLAVEAAPESGESAAELAFVLHRLDCSSEARLWLIRALHLEPGHHEARALLGNLLYEAGERRDALRHLVRIPATAFWDVLTIWRAVELERSFRGEEATPRVDALLARLEELTARSAPEDRLLEELEARSELGAGSGAGQLDLFRPGAEPEPPAPEGRRQDWEAIVAEMCLRSSNPFRTVEQYMRETASRIRARTGIAIPHHDPREFLRASARAGALNIPD